MEMMEMVKAIRAYMIEHGYFDTTLKVAEQFESLEEAKRLVREEDRKKVEERNKYWAARGVILPSWEEYEKLEEIAEKEIEGEE